MENRSDSQSLVFLSSIEAPFSRLVITLNSSLYIAGSPASGRKARGFRGLMNRAPNFWGLRMGPQKISSENSKPTSEKLTRNCKVLKRTFCFGQKNAWSRSALILFKLHYILSWFSGKLLQLLSPDSCFIAKMHQIRFQLELHIRPRWWSLQRLPDSLVGFKGA